MAYVTTKDGVDIFYKDWGLNRTGFVGDFFI